MKSNLRLHNIHRYLYNIIYIYICITHYVIIIVKYVDK